MHISEIYVYPIKSLQPTRLTEATITRHGILYDRCFMLLKVVDDAPNNWLKNMHVPEFPQMSLFLTELVLSEEKNGKIIVTYQEPPVSSCRNPRTLEIPLQPGLDGLEEISITMHQSPIVGYNMGSKYSDWFSDCFGFRVVLAYTGQNRRRVLGSMNPNIRREGWLSTLTTYVPRLGPGHGKDEKEEGILTFADCAAYMVVNDMSVKQVASRFPEGHGGVEVTRFRPNLVVGGAESAWEEDFWAELSLGGGDVQLVLTSNCVRCRSLDVDFDTGGFHKTDDGMVYKKLNKDRRVDKGAKYSPVFGRYGFLKGDVVVAKIRVGDAVRVDKTATERTTFDWPVSHCP
ncbi:hypothetical protein UA08_04423 [Talaromyces atroroseus]|uniref:MOSC domain-containing protein n=1 Tax=Talaromyces atroroseus TaxID=1441469 RepID=A0A1Q5Q8J6_TALAT|nr:hypothetical protein UA08_04423 [Talaromyces atroroseus]OKL60458.1 hypothetical protein UA08_04423 [Talaromyces atroroseus]